MKLQKELTLNENEADYDALSLNRNVNNQRHDGAGSFNFRHWTSLRFFLVLDLPTTKHTRVSLGAKLSVLHPKKHWYQIRQQQKNNAMLNKS